MALAIPPDCISESVAKDVARTPVAIPRNVAKDRITDEVTDITHAPPGHVPKARRTATTHEVIEVSRVLLVIKTVANLQRQSEEKTVETTQSQIADMDIAETADGCGEVWVPVTRTQTRIMITREEHEVPRGQQGKHV